MNLKKQENQSSLKKKHAYKRKRDSLSNEIPLIYYLLVFYKMLITPFNKTTTNSLKKHHFI
jgi:hypothetical protein